MSTQRITIALLGALALIVAAMGFGMLIRLEKIELSIQDVCQRESV